MRTLKLTIEYDGTAFHGWQIQADGTRTVQGALEICLQKILQHSLRVYGSGRTDSGVHAKGQVAHIHTSSTIPTPALMRAMNTYLPSDITISGITEAPENFHAQFGAVRKMYRYTILNRPEPSALAARFATHIPYPLHAGRMRRAARCFRGIHDFRSFVASNPARRDQSQDTRRQVFRSQITTQGDFILYDIEANGFMYKMVRNLVGTLICAGAGTLTTRQVKDILRAKDRNSAPDTAPPQGLCLMHVTYPQRAR